MHDVRNIWCLGRAYADHAKELGNQVPDQPLIFLKAGSCVSNDHKIQLPNSTDEFHYELELGLKFDDNLNFSHYCAAIDLTNRSKQSDLKKKGQAWTAAKSFKAACPISCFQSITEINPEDTSILLKLNGQTKQSASTSLLLFPIEEMRNFLIENYPVCPGDLFLSGTPAGVGALKSGDLLECELGKIHHSWSVE